MVRQKFAKLLYASSILAHASRNLLRFLGVGASKFALLASRIEGRNMLRSNGEAGSRTLYVLKKYLVIRDRFSRKVFSWASGGIGIRATLKMLSAKADEGSTPSWPTCRMRKNNYFLLFAAV